MSNQWWRLGGLFGIGFIILFIIGPIIVQGSTPFYDDPVEEIREYWVDDGDTYLIGDFIAGLGFMLFFLPFVVILRELLARAEGAVPIWSQVAFAAGIITIAVTAAAGFAWGALAFGDYAENASDSEIQLLMTLDAYAFSLLGFTLGTFVLASSLVMSLTGVLWRWLGWLGLLVGIGAIVSALGILDEDSEDVFDIIRFIAFIAFAVWLLITSIGMWMRKEDPQARVMSSE